MEWRFITGSKDFEICLKRNFAHSLEFLHREIIHNNPVAAYVLGCLYVEGEYVERSSKKALELFEKAAEWSLTSIYSNDVRVRAVEAIYQLRSEPSKLAALEQCSTFKKSGVMMLADRLRHHPFFIEQQGSVEVLLESLSVIYRKDRSYNEVISRTEPGSISGLSDIRSMIDALNEMYNKYSELCATYGVTPVLLNNVKASDCYPFATYQTIENIVSDVAKMYLSLRCSQQPAFKSFTLSGSDSDILDQCESCDDHNFAMFIVSLVELKIELEGVLSLNWYLYKATVTEKYEKVSEILKSLAPNTDNDIRFDEQAFKPYLPTCFFLPTRTQRRFFHKLVERVSETRNARLR